MAFARTPEFEDLFARDYPHLRRLVDGHPDDQPAEAIAVRMLDAIDAAHYHVDWPREVAPLRPRARQRQFVRHRVLRAPRLPKAAAGLRNYSRRTV